MISLDSIQMLFMLSMILTASNDHNNFTLWFAHMIQLQIWNKNAFLLSIYA